jgi:hypothetical protein
MFGTVKNANIVIVKLPHILYTGGDPQVRIGIMRQDFLRGLVKILDDVRQNKLQQKAVLNISWGCKLKVLKT